MMPSENKRHVKSLVHEGITQLGGRSSLVILYTLRSSITNENEIQAKLIEAHASKMREKEMEW